MTQEVTSIAFNGRVYFRASELVCKGSGLATMAEGFPEALLAIRLAYGKAMSLTSTARSSAHNALVGGSAGSYHICDTGRGAAATDVKMYDARERAEFIALALSLGWSVGVNRAFIHIDRRIDHGAEQLMFVY